MSDVPNDNELAMVSDDQNRIWIASITRDSTSYKWRVVNSRGKLLARFTLPGKRAERNVFFSSQNYLVQGNNLPKKKLIKKLALSRLFATVMKLNKKSPAQTGL